jgi:hypothetical protein
MFGSFRSRLAAGGVSVSLFLSACNNQANTLRRKTVRKDLPVVSASAASPSRANLLADPGFERISSKSASDWLPFERGYRADSGVHRSGRQSLRCDNASPDEKRGAVYALTLNQKEPGPLLVSGWSRARNVSGTPDSDYSLYVDLEYADGTPLWGQVAPFSAGSHDWQFKKLLISPTKPIKTVKIYALFRNHTGTVWFDDLSAVSLLESAGFDSQPVSPPRLPSGAKSGWFARDVAADSPILPLLGANGQPGDGARRLRLRLTGLKSDAGGRVASATIVDQSGKPRAVTVYYVEKFDPKNPVWWNDIRRSYPIASKGERGNFVPCNAGATGSQSLYPFGCVTGANGGRALGAPPLLGPRISRIGYNPASRSLYVAFDLGLTAANLANNDGHGHGSARIAVVKYDVNPRWGFRDAAQTYYRLFPSAFERRAKRDGIWMPFTDPSKVEGVRDFGIAYHEGDNSVPSDDRLGILSFRYTEPMTYWMPMPPSMPRTYENAVAMARKNAAGKDPERRRWAQAVLLSGSQDENGRFNLEFRNTPWANGAVWVLNPNPRLPHKPDQWTKARLNYSPEIADKAYGPQAKGVQDGEYLDSLEGWADTLDFRPESIRYALTPPTFSTETHRPVIPTWFSVYEQAAAMRKDLLRRGKLFMANTAPVRKSAFAPLFDVMGIETNWLPGGQWTPEDDAIFNLRRTLSYHKPYLLLQNTDYDKFGTPEVEKYFRRCLFYGVFPSMFSADAANSPYWETPRWYNRDRPLFKRYLPIIQRLSAAGWEPVTWAHSDNPDVYVERYGKDDLTLFNDSKERQRAEISLDPEFKQGPLQGDGKGGTLLLVSLLKDAARDRVLSSADLRFTVVLEPESVIAYHLQPAAESGP